MADPLSIMELQLKLASADTMNGLKAVAVEARKTAGAIKLGSDEQIAASKLGAEAQNQLNAAKQVGLSTDAKTKQSYFELGTAVRAFRFEQRLMNYGFRETTMMATQLGAAFGGEGIGAAMGSAIMTFRAAEVGISGLGMAAQAAGGKAAGFGEMISGMAIPLAALGGAMLFIIKTTADWNKEMEEQRGRIDDLKVKLGELSETEVLYSRLEKARAEGGDIGLWDKFKSFISGGTFGIITKQAADLEEAVDKARVALFDFFKTGATGQPYGPPRPIAEPRYGFQGLEDQLVMQYYKTQRGVLPQGPLASLIPNIPGTLTGVNGITPTEKEKFTKVEFEELSDEAKTFYGGMSEMNKTLAGEIHSGLGQAFTSVFGEANSLMQKLLQSFIVGIGDAIGKLLTQKAISNIPIIGPWLSEATTSSSSGNMLAGTDSMRPTPSSSGVSQIGQIANMLANQKLSMRLRGNDMHVFLDRTQLAYNQGVM